MLNIRKILFPTDFSDCSKEALHQAVKIAQEHGSELHLLHAIVLHTDDPHDPSHHLPDPSRIRKILEELATERMGALVRDHDIPDLVVRQIHRRDISAAPPIVEYARETDIDLIVMGTHGRRGVRKLLLGSVAAEVIRMAPCSVMTVRGKGERTYVHDMSRILAPVDFSDPGENALAVACKLAKTYGSQLQLVHVLGDILHPTFYNMGATRLSDLQPEILQSTESALEGLLDDVGDCQGAPVEFHALEGHPWREIVRFSRDHDSDLIVMATHGLSGIKHILLGSTAEKVIGAAECPVLVVKGLGESRLL
jgi:nucleotide-binding universal stress UspA family protein